MRRIAATCWLAASLTTLLGDVVAQRPAPPARPPSDLVVLLRDPSGAPVQDATGWLLCEPGWHLPALATAPRRLLGEGTVPLAVERTATSNERGILRFRGQTHAGAGMVTTKAGLGALLPRQHAGRAQRVALQPLAEITTATGSEPLAIYARARLADGSEIDLPVLRGAKVRVPAGDYELWASSADGWIWLRMTLRPGERRELSFLGEAMRLRCAPGALVHPAHRPELDLLRDQDASPAGTDLVLRGAALGASLVTWLGGVVTPPRGANQPLQTTSIAWPPLADRRERQETFRLPPGSDEQANLFGLLRRDDGHFRIVGYARSQNGLLQMPGRPTGDSWLLLLSPGRAPLAKPWSTTKDGAVLQAAPGRQLVVTVRDQGNAPVQDMIVEYLPDGADAATSRATTDARGVARFGRVRGPGLVRTSDARYGNQELELDRIPPDAVPLQAPSGDSLTATAVFDAPGQPSAGSIVVTLRDTLGRLRPAERSRVVEAGQPFTFGGLPAERDLVVFATAQRAGKTWSARRIVRAGDERVRLELRNEDPVLGPGQPDVGGRETGR